MLDFALFLLVQCPMVGFAVMFGGHVVGNMLETPTGTVGLLHKYGLLIGLGFITTAIHMSVAGTL